MTFDITEPGRTMVPDLERLFTETIMDTFRKNGIDSPAELGHEIEEKVALVQRRVGTFVPDCGYRTSQAFWRRFFGDPTVSFPNFFGEEEAYAIWHVSTDWARVRVTPSGDPT